MNSKIKSAVTISLVEEARGGPFVFWDGLANGFEKAASFGFDAVEIFAPGPDAVEVNDVKQLVQSTGLAVAAVGTGAGMVKHGLSLTDPDSNQRSKAIDFIKSLVDFGANFDAPAIIGSMQGRWGGDIDKAQALQWLADSLTKLGSYAGQFNLPLIYEPLNRYESNLINTLDDTAQFLIANNIENVKILADLFHMNIEESDLAGAIRNVGDRIGHVHYVDSNRQAAGFAHTDFSPIADAIKEIKYTGYLSAEVFPLPDSDAAAQQTINSIRTNF